MSYRRGRGRGGPKGATWEFDPTLKLDNTPTDDFPPYKPSTPPEITDKEKRQVKYQLEFQRRLREGPLYTHSTKIEKDSNAAKKLYNEEQVNNQYGKDSPAEYNPFTDVPMWSDQFKLPKRALPEIKGEQWDPRFFPEELHSILPGGGVTKPKKKAETQTKAERRKVLERYLKAQEEEEAAEGEGDDEDARAEGDEDNEEGRRARSDDEPDPDDAFEDDEEEMAGDYNAEGYFDTGEGDDDFGDGDEGGGGEEY